MAAGAIPAATTVNGRTAVDLTAGVAPTPTDGDQFTNTGREFLHVYNPDKTSLTLAFDIPATVDGNAVADKSVTTSIDSWIIGPFPTNYYNDGNGKVLVTCTGTLTNVKLKVFKFS